MGCNSHVRGGVLHVGSSSGASLYYVLSRMMVVRGGLGVRVVRGLGAVCLANGISGAVWFSVIAACSLINFCLCVMMPKSLVCAKEQSLLRRTCFKVLWRVTGILIRHARNLRRVRYGKALLRLFIKKPSVALKSIMRTSEGITDTPSLPTYLSVLRDETTGHLINAPEEAIAKITQMEPVAQSPDPTLPWVPLFPG